ncbi:MAG: cation diffusion facilitator family transporter [Defluviitaleaceae bacterium]|nr:cation diffusion facilitator family transporter [Defluviitaleaceae bacterium]
MKKTTKSNEQTAISTARNSIIINILLSSFKLFAGIFANSAAMVSDAVHSFTDLISTVIAVIGIKLANKKPDKEHPYGHERFECVATLALALLVFTVGIGIGWAGVQRIISGDISGLSIPGILALVAAIVSIGAKEGLYWYVRAAAKKIDSSALMADAWHSRVDGLSSIGSFIGILGARLGFPVLDSVAAIVICLFILKTAISIAQDALGRMTDKACDDTTVEAMRVVILIQDAVNGIDTLRTRIFGSKIYVDVDISVAPTLSIAEGHAIAQQVHDAIEKSFPKVKHCMVHVNPTVPSSGPAAAYPS